MKPMEYTIKVVAQQPVDPNEITGAIENTLTNVKAECVSYRVQVKPREKKA